MKFIIFFILIILIFVSGCIATPPENTATPTQNNPETLPPILLDSSFAGKSGICFSSFENPTFSIYLALKTSDNEEMDELINAIISPEFENKTFTNSTGKTEEIVCYLYSTSSPYNSGTTVKYGYCRGGAMCNTNKPNVAFGVKDGKRVSVDWDTETAEKIFFVPKSTLPEIVKNPFSGPSPMKCMEGNVARLSISQYLFNLEQKTGGIVLVNQTGQTVSNVAVSISGQTSNGILPETELAVNPTGFAPNETTTFELSNIPSIPTGDYDVQYTFSYYAGSILSTGKLTCWGTQ